MSANPQYEGPRLIRPDEYPAVGRLDQICFSGIPTLASPPEPAEVPPVADEAPDENDDEIYGIAVDGQIVSKIGVYHTGLQIMEALVDVGSIGGVCTHPDFERQGIATRLLEFCAQRMTADGARVMLISGSRGLYTRTGSVPTGRYTGFAFTPGQFHPSAEKIAMARGITLRPAGPADAPLCARLYQAEPVHFRRTPGRFTRRFSARPDFFNAESWIIDMAGQPAAYLLFNRPWEAGEVGRESMRDIGEYAGSRIALAGALSILMAAGSAYQSLWMLVPWQDTDLIQLLTDFGGKPEPACLSDHTWRILNLPGLLGDLQPYLAARLPGETLAALTAEQTGPLLAGIAAEPDRCAISLGADRLELPTAEMTRLVLGDARLTPDQFNLPGRLAEILPNLFPLPAFLPGIDYH